VLGGEARTSRLTWRRLTPFAWRSPIAAASPFPRRPGSRLALRVSRRRIRDSGGPRQWRRTGTGTGAGSGPAQIPRANAHIRRWPCACACACPAQPADPESSARSQWPWHQRPFARRSPTAAAPPSPRRPGSRLALRVSRRRIRDGGGPRLWRRTGTGTGAGPGPEQIPRVSAHIRRWPCACACACPAQPADPGSSARSQWPWYQRPIARRSPTAAAPPSPRRPGSGLALRVSRRRIRDGGGPRLWRRSGTGTGAGSGPGQIARAPRDRQLLAAGGWFLRWPGQRGRSRTQDRCNPWSWVPVSSMPTTLHSRGRPPRRPAARRHCPPLALPSAPRHRRPSSTQASPPLPAPTSTRRPPAR